ncbi:TlpA disulfide reductase family protein [Paraglaciecola aquimarina]|uniref:TlpA disulfide reductase family protein n=1 Tax=Paraglaciecola aquimarina TaxID=1235557 RepID=A0ABU3SU09_9ALTE|nr:TlpA disulfide reductase family protein [Paraglaciecola aquimarina]MDU0353486.1 TlpA disulfide reductase family protein [Paraglaciecola aquimarina]
MLNKYKFKTLVVLFCVTFASSWLANAQAAKDFSLNLGPNFATLPAKLSGLKGQVVYLDFWASWCKPCRKSFPWMNNMQQQYAGQGLQIITVNLDQEANLAEQFLTQTPTNLPIVYDPQGKIAEAYQLLGMPSSYLIDRAGNIRVSHAGFFSKKQKQYEQEIVSLLAEKE